VDRIHVDAVLEPPLSLSNVHIVAAHLPLPHPPVWGKGPVFQPVGAVPLAGFVMPLVPKLHGDLYGRGRRVRCKHQAECGLTLLSAKANSSLRSRYPFSLFHFCVKNATISSCPLRKVSRFRQIESSVYAFLTTAGLLLSLP
jgi:hypothetical protein